MDIPSSAPPLPLILLTLVTLRFPSTRGVTIEETFCTKFSPSSPTVGGNPAWDVFFKDERIFGASSILRRKSPENCLLLPPTEDVTPYYHPKVYGIKDKILVNNWIQYELEFLRIKNVDIDAIIIQADNDKYAGFGQFVPTPGSVKGPLPTQFAPCSFPQSEDTLTPTIFIYTNDARIAKLAEQIPDPLKLFWKFTQSMCNSPGKVTFRGIFAKKPKYLKLPEASNKSKLATKIYPLLFLIPPITITLSNQFLGQAPSILSSEPGRGVDPQTVPWITEVEENLETNQTWNFSTRCEHPPKPSEPGIPFYGCGDGEMPRCEDPQTLNTRVTLNHGRYPEYDDYIYHRLQKYCFCPRPFRKAGPEPVLHSRDLHDNVLPLEPKEANDTEEHLRIPDSGIDGIGVVDFPGSYIWNFRIVHGVSHVISGLFITPLSIFIARNYKETFMKSSILFNKPWFMLHILSVFINFLLHCCGMFAAFTGMRVLGVSKSSGSLTDFRNSYKSHRMMGYGNTMLFIVLMLLGGVRPYNTCLRRGCIAIHYFLGIVYYLSTLYLIYLSVRIPGSPSDGRKTNRDKTGNSSANRDLIALLIVIWLGIDVGFHLTMMVLAYIGDHTVRIRRKLWIVPIPILSEFNRTDLPGGFLRKILLGIYFFIALIICGMICVIIVYPPKMNQGYGQMTCSPNFTNISLKADAHTDLLLKCKLHPTFDTRVIRKLVKKKIKLKGTFFETF